MNSKTLLLIEKNYSLLNVFKRILERDGYNVYSVVDLAQARDMLTQITPDGVILENELPDGSGIDFCEELRRSYKGPILFQSWTGDDEVSSLRAGASDFMKLPFDMDEAKLRIRRMMEFCEDFCKDSSVMSPAEAAAEEAAPTAAVVETPVTETEAAPVAEASPVEENYSPDSKRLQKYIRIASCFAAILAIVGVLIIYGYTHNSSGSENNVNVFDAQPSVVAVEVEDEQVPLAEFPGEDD